MFYDFVRKLFLPIFRGETKPSPSHHLLRHLQDGRLLRRVYTQNIDFLESHAGVADNKVVNCHGSFDQAMCLHCGKNPSDMDADFWQPIEGGRVPTCKLCQDDGRAVDAGRIGANRSNITTQTGYLPPTDTSATGSTPVATADANGVSDVSGAILRPCVTFFGEGLPERFHTLSAEDLRTADGLIVMGTSLQVNMP